MGSLVIVHLQCGCLCTACMTRSGSASTIPLILHHHQQHNRCRLCRTIGRQLKKDQVICVYDDLLTRFINTLNPYFDSALIHISGNACLQWNLRSVHFPSHIKNIISNSIAICKILILISITNQRFDVN